MQHSEHAAGGVRAGRALIAELRQLGTVRAPAGVRARVLGRLGLTDAYFRVATPLGDVFVAYNVRGIVSVMRVPSPEVFEQAFVARYGRVVLAAAPPPALARGVERHLRVGRGAIRLDLAGLGAFERAVLLKALTIPRGEVRPYGWIAREIGHPRAVRAVGTALARNPIPLLIPCHRVVRSDGSIGQYSLGGAEAKRRILSAEGLDVDALRRDARSGATYIGSTTTHVYCYATCRHARRISARHRVGFATVAAATAAGYRPCAACRPAAVP